jgi:hypothetical protein
VTTVTFRKLAVLTLATGIMLGASSPNAHARKIVCWKNHENVRECGNSVPPEFAQKSIERKSKMGMTLEKTERAKTQEELAASREERTRLRKEKAENDLQLASKGKVAAIDSRVKHSEQLVTKLEGTRDDIQNEAAQIERGGKKVLEALAKKFNDVQVQIDSTQGQIEQRNKERIQVQEQFESDLVRYRELKGS